MKPRGTLLEIIKELDGRIDIWFRPVSWKGLGCAHVLNGDGNRIKFVPTSRGGQTALFPYVEEILDEWEIVDPHEVNQETVQDET